MKSLVFKRRRWGVFKPLNDVAKDCLIQQRLSNKLPVRNALFQLSWVNYLTETVHDNTIPHDKGVLARKEGTARVITTLSRNGAHAHN